jgi:hypothetical protein
VLAPVTAAEYLQPAVDGVNTEPSFGMLFARRKFPIFLSRNFQDEGKRKKLNNENWSGPCVSSSSFERTKFIKLRIICL